jgi:predicted extracellular nuclease
MKKIFTFILICLTTNLVNGQCQELFFSEYVEGWSNNKALEIYNPTPNTIDLSAYSISRYSNGGTSPSTSQLSGSIEPFSTFVIGLDKRNPDGTGFEAPMWDGNYTYIDSITNEEVTIYNEDDDLQSKIDLFLNPTYYSGTNADSALVFPTTMYFNGNDALTLEVIGVGVVDVFGKVGEDPGSSWVDNDDNYWTKDHTLIRKYNIVSGLSSNPTIFDPTSEWDSLAVNSFTNLGSHDCECNEADISKISELHQDFVTYPNPVNYGSITILNSSKITQISIYNLSGKLINKVEGNDQATYTLQTPKTPGLYFIEIQDENSIKKQSVLVR